MKPLSNYIKVGPEWVVIDFAPIPPSQVPFNGFYVRADGIQMNATVRREGAIEIIDVSLCPLTAMQPDVSFDDLVKHILDQAPQILADSFPGRKFAKAPKRWNYTDKCIHFFSPLAGEG